MERLTKTQLPILISYSSPFVVLLALTLNIVLLNIGLAMSSFRLLILSAAFPAGFSLGRFLYLKRSHIEIAYDDEAFRVFKGAKEVTQGKWRSFRAVSIILDQFGKPDLRLYKTIGGDHVDLPISKTNARPQEFRDYVQELVLAKKATSASLQVSEVS